MILRTQGKKPSPWRIARVRRWKALIDLPLTSAEKALYLSRVAAVRAQDELRQHPAGPQLTLPCEPAGTV